MKKLLFSIILFSLPLVSFGAYVRSPSGTASSTSFGFSIANPPADLSGWNGSGNSWKLMFSTTSGINASANWNYVYGTCFSNGASQLSLRNGIDFPTSTNFYSVGYGQWTSGDCTTGAAATAEIEGTAPRTAALFQLIASSTEESSSTATSTTSNVNQEIFYGLASNMLVFLLTLGIALLTAYIIYKIIL